MKLSLKRKEFRADGIFSELLNEAGELLAYTLEHSFDEKPKLNDGVHKCVRGIHKLHDQKPFETFEILGVPGHTGILFHVGNFNKDSDGCVLLGTGVAEVPQGQMITNSRVAFTKFLVMLENINEFTLEVS